MDESNQQFFDYNELRKQVLRTLMLQLNSISSLKPPTLPRPTHRSSNELNFFEKLPNFRFRYSDMEVLRKNIFHHLLRKRFFLSPIISFVFRHFDRQILLDIIQSQNCL